MDHPLFRKRLSRLSITEIRRAVADYPPDEALIAKLQRDPRAGVRALADSLENRRERGSRLETKHEEMLAIERGLRANGSNHIAGLDEAGRGPLAGPVSVGCVILPENIHLPGLDDSKKMSAKAREEMYARIAEEAVAWTVVLLDHLEIDELGIHGAVMEGMRRAVDRLGFRPDTALVDGRSLPGLGCRERAIVDGDALCLSIAAASVMAKVTRDRVMVEMDARYPEYGFAGHKGYGCEEHVEALRKYGPCPIHRFSFRTIAEVSPPGTVRAALEHRLRDASTAEDLERAAAGIGRNGELFGGETLEYLRGVYRECREDLGRKR
jgi:ribonuclease HII